MNDRPAEPAPAGDAPASGAPAEAVSAPSPGALLRQARERTGLAADDLAAQIKLAKSTLEALERDDFAALSEPVYVRGYYRKIAKVLPVAEAELLEAYRAHAARARPSPRPMTHHVPLADGSEAAGHRRSRGPGLGLALLAIIAAAALFVLVQQRLPVRGAPRPAAAPAPAAEQAPAPAASTETPMAAMPPPATPDAAAQSPNQLVLEFSDASFVRVEDGRNRTLAIGLVRAGERQVLDGQPPYSVFLGNAHNVKVFYGGQSVDFAAHINTQNDTARFTVP